MGSFTMADLALEVLLASSIFAFVTGIVIAAANSLI